MCKMHNHSNQKNDQLDAQHNMRSPLNMNMEVSTLLLLHVHTYSTMEETSVESQARSQGAPRDQTKKAMYACKADRYPLDCWWVFTSWVIQSRGTCPFGPIRFSFKVPRLSNSKNKQTGNPGGGRKVDPTYAQRHIQGRWTKRKKSSTSGQEF